MSRYLLPFLILAFFLGACASTNPASSAQVGSGPQWEEAELELDGGSRWRLHHPIGWQYSFGEGVAPNYLTIRFEGPDKFAPVLRITALGYSQNLVSTQEPLDSIVEELVIDGCQRFLPDSVEQEINLEHLYLERGAGAYATFTDAALLGAQPKKGDFLMATSGVMIRDGWTIAFSFFDYQDDPATLAMALSVVESIAPPNGLQARSYH